MTTSKKLWLGFGTLTALLVLSSVAIILRVRSIEGQVGEMANAARSLSVAARQLEINTLGYALDLRAYFQTGESQARQDADEEAAAVDRHFKEYERLAATDRQREMAARFGRLWQELKALGQTLLDAEPPQLKLEDSKKFYDLRIGLERFLDGEMQVDAVETYDARRDAALQDVRTIVGFALILLIVGVVIAVVTSGAVGRGVVKAEGLVRANRELLRVTLASIGDAVISTDTQGRVTYLNAVAESLTGWRNDEAASQPLDAVFRIVHEETRQTVENPATRALREGVIVGLANHTVLIAKDGTERPIDDSAAPIQDEQGKVAGVVLIFRDVTVNRQAEQALRESEQRFRVLFDLGPVAVFSCNREGVIQNYNRRAAELWGREPKCGDVSERFCGSLKLYHPDERLLPHTESPIVQVLRTGVAVKDAEVFIERPDGSRVSVIVAFAPLKTEQGEITGAITAFYDITERMRAEESLRESEQRCRFVMDSMPQKIFTAKPNGDVDYFNPQWTEFTGLSFEQIRDWGWTQFIHPDDVAENVRVWKQSIDTGEPFQFEHRFRRADGEYRWHFSRALPLRDAEGRILMWVGSNTDVHEQAQTANKLRQLAADLSEADRRKNEFLATLAHELRNPLAPIRNMLEIMKRADDNTDTIQQARNMMERQLSQLTRLIDDLLDVSRISRGRIELRKGRVELASIVHQAVEAAAPAAECAKHELTVTLPPQAIYLHADPVRLAQVFGNLLSNACKYTEPGGEGSILLTAEKQGGDVVVSVKDNGVGIPPDMLHKVFEMFTQVEQSLERSQGGLGIGLSLVKTLVEMHNGSVEAHSAGLGQGSEVVVRLPIMVETPPLPPPATTPPAPTGRGRRILVVDDNRDSAQSLAMLLEITGNQTQTAHDGLEAVEAAATFRPDVVLLDIGLPKLNGYEAARRIREQPWGKGVVLVAVTGWGQDEDRRKAKDAGFDGHIVKPVDYDTLMKVLAEARPTPV